MSPIESIVGLQLQQELPLDIRSQWDPKAVGGHLLLGKRSSTPVGLNFAAQMNKLSALQSLSEGMIHKRLDRTQSEPHRQMQQQQLQQQQLQQLQPQIQPGSPESSRSSSSSRYKTELCRPFGETGFCKYGEKCQFAHGGSELRTMPRHPKYKTELCRTFHTTGLCGYGSRCHFIHNADERRHPSKDAPLAPSPPASLSPTSQGGSFFDDSFRMPADDFSPFVGLDTPPISPVESLAGDMDAMSLSPTPSPPNNLMMFRLPIFETLSEAP